MFTTVSTLILKCNVWHLSVKMHVYVVTCFSHMFQSHVSSFGSDIIKSWIFRGFPFVHCQAIYLHGPVLPNGIEFSDKRLCHGSWNYGHSVSDNINRTECWQVRNRIFRWMCHGSWYFVSWCFEPILWVIMKTGQNADKSGIESSDKCVMDHGTTAILWVTT